MGAYYLNNRYQENGNIYKAEKYFLVHLKLILVFFNSEDVDSH